MKKLFYEGDSTGHGGRILSDIDHTKVNRRSAAKIGTLVSCPIHGDHEIIEGTSRIRAAGSPLSRDGDATQYGSVRITSTQGATVR